MLDRKEAFSIINSGNPFAIEYCSLDFTANTGGKKHSYPEVNLHKRINEAAPTQHSTLNTLPVKKNPNHIENITLNILLPGGQIRKVHVPLILKINGQPVL